MSSQSSPIKRGVLRDKEVEDRRQWRHSVKQKIQTGRSMRIVIWGCSTAQKSYYEFRVRLRDTLRKLGHTAILPETEIKKMNIGKNQPGKVVRAEHEQARDAHIVVSIPKAPGSLVELGLFLGKREVRRKMFVVWQKSWSNGFAGLVVTATMGLDGCQKVTYSGPSDVRSEALLAEVVTRIKGFCDALDF